MKFVVMFMYVVSLPELIYVYENICVYLYSFLNFINGQTIVCQSA